jgi:hypothetical protein
MLAESEFPLACLQETLGFFVRHPPQKRPTNPFAPGK